MKCEVKLACDEQSISAIADEGGEVRHGHVCRQLYVSRESGEDTLRFLDVATPLQNTVYPRDHPDCIMRVDADRVPGHALCLFPQSQNVVGIGKVPGQIG